jgi:pimeloyl-ACP methyl ester carboxylesterase
MSKIFALLVGINDYPTIPLKGCINDVTGMKTCLEKLYANNPQNELNIKTLITAKDTKKAAIINNFQNFYKDAESDDICIFYYSGHGSYAKAPKEFKSANGNLQSFVCSDSRDFGGVDLVDKEMAYLLWSATHKKLDLNFLVITDCCHSGTITKSFIDNSKVQDRRRSGDDAHMPKKIEDYLGYSIDHNGELGYQSYQENGINFVKMKNGKHLHLSACQDSQTAKELLIDNEIRGAFTTSLIKSLYASSGHISYRELCEQIGANVSSLVADQSPSFKVIGENNPNSADQNFLSDDPSISQLSYIVYHDPSMPGWALNAGKIHNIHKGDVVLIENDIETVVIASPIPDKSMLRSQSGLDPYKQYKAQVFRQAEYASIISFGTEVRDNFKQEVTKLLSNHNYEDYGIIIDADQPGQFIIHSDGMDNYFLSHPGSDQPILHPEKLYQPKEIEVFLNAVSSVAKWHQLKALKLTSTVEKNKVYEIIIQQSIIPGDFDKDNFVPLIENNEVSEIEHSLYYKLNQGSWQPPIISIEIKNKTKAPLWVTNAYLGFDYGISDRIFGELEIAPEKSAFLPIITSEIPEESFAMTLDKKYQDLGYDRISEYLKLFISDQKITTEKLNQESRQLPKLSLRNDEKSKTISEKTPEPRITQVPKKFALAETIGFKIISSEAEIEIKENQANKIGALTLKPHSSFSGKALLSSESSGTKSANQTGPVKLAYLNENLEPLSLNYSTRSDTISSIIEFFNVKNAKEVNAINPLIFDTKDLPYIDNADILPLGYDAKEELYYPLGYTDSKNNQIIIQTLPEETKTEGAINEKSFLGSIKIYFQKVIGKKLGFQYNFPILAKVTVDDENNVCYEDNINELKTAVANATNMLLFIHGIIGDTKEMVKCVNMPLNDNKENLKSKAELILSFDYENLNTPIEQTARDLKAALEAIDLNPGHKKNLTIIAHSMGGLVSRWFIEKDNGDQIVNKLIMLGTPNNGTPWSDVRDMASVLLTFAINGAAYLQPYLMVLTGIGKLLQGLQVTLKQMNNDSDMYKTLNSPNGIKPYVIISGNTQKLIQQYADTLNKIEKLFKKLIDRGVYDTLDLAIFKEANDIAVSTKSISTLPNAKNQPQVFEVASDHISYFTRPEVILLINQALKSSTN